MEQIFKNVGCAEALVGAIWVGVGCYVGYGLYTKTSVDKPDSSRDSSSDDKPIDFKHKDYNEKRIDFHWENLVDRYENIKFEVYRGEITWETFKDKLPTWRQAELLRPKEKHALFLDLRWTKNFLERKDKAGEYIVTEYIKKYCVIHEETTPEKKIFLQLCKCLIFLLDGENTPPCA
jgi:hypothetical protein